MFLHASRPQAPLRVFQVAEVQNPLQAKQRGTSMDKVVVEMQEEATVTVSRGRP